jgi:hypothetical protein
MQSKWYKDMTENQIDDLKKDPKLQKSLRWFKRPVYQYTSIEGGEHGNSNTDSAVYSDNRTISTKSV